MPRDWEEHYRNRANADLSPDALVAEAAEWLPPGGALDLACGTGRHALYLAKLGWQVTAVDASAVALDLLRRNVGGLPVDVRRADLERCEFTIGPESYDLICDFLYLQRSLFPAIREGIRPGGLFLGAMRLDGTFRIEPGELRREFAAWKIVYYSESGGIAKIAARKA
ncbi:MAG: methyltransferase domain-containing protein [Candidatus Sulfopaludibacter sp.]|nr:methyltransferase domain-containing protein [Candidatus Sulfopaludibacter sp.]